MPSWMQHWGPSCGLPPKHITCQLQASANGWIGERSAAEAVLQKKNVQIVSPTCHVCVCARVFLLCEYFSYVHVSSICTSLSGVLFIYLLFIYLPPLDAHVSACTACHGNVSPLLRLLSTRSTTLSAACFLLAVVGAVVGIARMQFDPAGLNLSG